MSSVERKLPAGERRVFWLDAARALAVVSVSFNHALNRSVMLDVARMESPGLYGLLGSLLYVFSRLGVPLFLMISGALLMGRDYSRPGALRRFYTHNWLQLLLVTLLWLGIRFWFFVLLRGTGGSPGALLRSFFRELLLLNSKDIGCMWYMAMILCVYPLIPLLAAAAERLPGRAFLVPGAMILALSFLIPNLNAALEGAGLSLRLQSALDGSYLAPLYLLYLVAGWYLSRGALARLSTGLLAGILAAGLAGTSLFMAWLQTAGTHYAVRYADAGILIAAAALFELLRRQTRPRLLGGRPVSSLAVHGLGIYFVHYMIMTALAALFQSRAPGLTGFRCFAVLELCGLLGAWAFVWLTAKIPFVGRVFYLIRDGKN